MNDKGSMYVKNLTDASQRVIVPIVSATISSVPDTVSQQDYSGVNWDFVGG